ncbi:MAG: carbamate kinase [Gemmatimonadota bacterium]
MAIGGNALSPSGEPATVTNQFRHTRQSLTSIVRFVLEGRRVAVVHGNGPQVGDELRRGELARGEVEPLPLGVLVASTAGWIGYMIQQSLQNALHLAGSDRRVVTVLSQVLVDPADPGLERPSKFVGRPVREEDREALAEEGYRVAEDARGRLRRQVPSPDPVGFVEAETIRELVERGHVVITGGGGGIPVYRDPELGLEGLDVVLDKDRSAALLAREIGASVLLILTDVDAVYRDFGTADARPIARLRVGEARELVAGSELGEGSMRPKVEAAVRFVDDGGGRAVIADLAEASRALAGDAGTEILPD